jgi:hypothetical protein
VPALRQLAHAAAALAAIPSPSEKGRYASVFLAEHQYRNSCFLHALKFILGIDIGNQSPLSVVFGMLTAMTSESSQIDDDRLRHLRAPGSARPPWASLLMGVSHPLYSVGLSETLLELPPCSRRGDWRPSFRPSPCFRLCPAGGGAHPSSPGSRSAPPASKRRAQA